MFFTLVCNLCKRLKNPEYNPKVFEWIKIYYILKNVLLCIPFALNIDSFQRNTLYDDKKTKKVSLVYTSEFPQIVPRKMFITINCCTSVVLKGFYYDKLLLYTCYIKKM